MTALDRHLAATPQYEIIRTRNTIHVNTLNGHVITACHSFSPDGRKSTCWGTPLLYQTLEEWQAHVSRLRGPYEIKQAWRELLYLDSACRFEGEEYEKAKAMLVRQDARLEMQLTGK